MDITVILPSTNKAGNDLVKILEQDGKQKEFKKVVVIIRSYMDINRHLLTRQVTMQYLYDTVYRDFVEKTKTKFYPKYSSYILSILHTKYVDYLIELKNLLELCDETDINNIEENTEEND